MTRLLGWFEQGNTVRENARPRPVHRAYVTPDTQTREPMCGSGNRGPVRRYPNLTDDPSLVTCRRCLKGDGRYRAWTTAKEGEQK
jgi:hypothetical protein